MWVLLMVLLDSNNTYLLNTFDTAEECQVERNRIGFEMAEAYPAACGVRFAEESQPRWG